MLLRVKEGVTDNSSGTIGVNWNCPCRNRIYGHSVTTVLSFLSTEDESHVKIFMTPNVEYFVAHS